MRESDAAPVSLDPAALIHARALDGSAVNPFDRPLNQPSDKKVGRLLHLDGIRALAALAVALFHYRSYLGELFAKVPPAIDVVVRSGYLGVNVFFVLSGFVIAHSLGTSRYSLAFLGRFVLRRQVRLAPPYWATVAIAAWWFSADPNMESARTSMATIASHLGYVQDILGYPQLLDVFWTLCIEVQLYGIYIGLAWLAQGNSPRWQIPRRDAVFVSTTLVSLLMAWIPGARLAVSLMPGASGPAAWFPCYWYMFALGVWARWALDSRSARCWLALFVSLAVIRACQFHGPGPMVCAVTAGLLYLAAYWQWLPRVLGCQPLAYLGRISYSFYLLHALIGGACLHWVLAHHAPTLLRDMVAMCAALGASLLAAQALWWAIERPAMAWSRRLGPPRQ